MYVYIRELPTPLRLWSWKQPRMVKEIQSNYVDMTSKARDVIFVRFDRYFASKLRFLLRGDSPRIPHSILELVRPKDHAKGLLVSHNWGDIIQYNVSTVIRVYGFLGKPHVLLFHVPMKIEIANLLW